MPGELRRIDRGMNRIRTALGMLPKGHVMVGWPGHGPKHRVVEHTASKSGKIKASVTESAGPMSVAQIAVVHEFGVPSANIPARPVMKQTNLKYRGALGPMQVRLLQQVYRGTIPPEQALKQMGVFWEGRIKATFREGSFAPLKPETIRRKGSSRPLIDSGQLRNSVTSRVVQV